MARLLPFRRRRRSTRSRDYRAGRKTYFWPENDPNHVTVRGVARETVQWLGRLRPFILLGILASLYVGVGDPALIEPPEFLSSEQERVSNHFTLCDQSRGLTCVVDGDTFKLGGRRIRIIGIDAPETHPPRCPEEARLGALATRELQALLNERPFELIAPVYRDRDRYGRELRVVRRVLADGSYQSIAGELRERGHARRYLGGLRSGWC